MGLFGFAASYIAFTAVHIVQLALALTTCGLYGVDLQRAHDARVPADPKWVYAQVVAGLSALTCIFYFVPFVVRFWLVWAWDFVLFILWIALFGVFGRMYIHEDAEGDPAVQRMKNAVWVVLTSALLWLLLALASLGYWWRHKERHSRFTGRARV